MNIDIDALESWAGMAAQAIQEVIDDAVDAMDIGPDIPEESVCPDLRGLLSDLNRIMAGGGSLMTQLKALPEDTDCKLLSSI
jgi:hypothetical protein